MKKERKSGGKLKMGKKWVKKGGKIMGEKRGKDNG